MKSNQLLNSSPSVKRVKKIWTPALLFLAGVFASHTLSFSARAGTFVSDFNSGLVPAGTTNYGSAIVSATGGVGDSGVLKLTTAVASQTGSLIINDLDAGTPVVSFTASFKARVGGGNGADGFSFNFAADLPDAPVSELGAGTGLTISFDTFDNGGGEAPAIEVFYGGASLTNALGNFLNTGANFVDVLVKVDPDGTLDVFYDGRAVINNFSAYTTPIAGRFGLGARTGSNTDNHFIDDLNIVTKTAANAYIESVAPLGPNIRPDAVVKIVLADSTTTVDTNKIQLLFDAVNVTSSSTITQSGPNTAIVYDPPGLLASNSTHTVSLTFADSAPNTNTFVYSFTVAAYGNLDTNLIAPGSLVSTNPGFTIRVSQIADNLGTTVARAENQLANRLIDPSTSLPYANLATPNPNDASFTYLETNVLNYSTAAAEGNFPGDSPIPGIPGTTASTANIALDAVAYLNLTPGVYTLGVNSADGFRLTTAANPDVFAPQAAVFDGARGPADTTVIFTVSQAGYYPFRVLYFAGAGITFPNSLEFFSQDANGVKTLINATNVVGYIPAVRVTTTSPYVQSASPTPNESSVPGNTVIGLVLVDGTLTVQTNTIQLSFNGSVVTPAITTNGAGVTTITFDPLGDLTPNSTNTVKLVFTDSGSNSRTNQYQFFAANILQQIFYLAPGSSPYITPPPAPGNTERGLAYNPKTDHVLLVSRTTPNPNIQILSATNGSNLGSMDVTGVAGGLFLLNMIDVADDGVIYACNLTTDSTVAANPFKIYRWDNEAAAPTVAYSANPAGTGLKMRLGDTFRVRRSGAGTQIIATENTGLVPGIGGTNAILFTTVDGTNFTSTRIAVPGIANGDIRLGLAFGCGNTFYGAVTAAGNSQMRYVTFDPYTGAATLTATYLLNNPGAATVGPLGVDLFSQRLIGNATSGTAAIPHSMNLYDLSSLIATPGTNFVLDRRVFATANAAFGTGAIDFTPDGGRLFTLDTANGILAFGLAPKLAAPSICGQPVNRTNGVGQIAFFAVEAGGSAQKFQWRFNGVNLPGRTNATLDIYNVQTNNAGNYAVVITNSLGSVTSSPARLYVSVTLLTQPASQFVPVGGTAAFSVTANGEFPITYQWQQNGTAITGATNDSLTITNAQQANAGGYTVVVSNPAGPVTSGIASLTVGTPGTGTGLTGDYYTAQLMTFNGPVTLSRLDPTVDFDFGTGSPDPNISADTFTARWTGEVQPFYSQTYTFYTRTDDGVRLWVNGQLLIDSWINQAPTERSGTITLVANQKYDIVMEYFENAGGAVAQLSWSSLGQVKQIVLQTQLYPGISPVQPTLATSLSNGTNLVLNWSGTFQLESSTNVIGPYSPVAGITNSPYTNIIGSEPAMFFRLLHQY